MTYQLLQDAHQSTQLGSLATGVLAAQERVAKAAVELEAATNAYQFAKARYDDKRAYMELMTPAEARAALGIRQIGERPGPEQDPPAA